MDDASAYYFTLQPTRNEYEFRSFLSLDLADSQSLRSIVRARREPSCLRHSKSTTNIRRPSRDSLRSIPSPKPAPMSTLPTPPTPLSPSIRAPSSIRPTPSVRAGNHAQALARLEGRTKTDFILLDDDSDVEMEPEDVVLPLSTLNRTPSRRSSSKCSSSVHPYSRKSRSKRSTWDPTSSWIDLSTRDSWNWRSFIDVGGI